MTYEKLQQGLILDVRKMFIFALLCGVLGVCVPQYFNVPLLAVVLPLLCMILYTWFGYLLSVDSCFMEQFADSVYYLGFLLTLVALVVSLYFYQSDTLEAGLLTANFSLALITTIFGLAVRIFINNFQIDLNSIERQMMNEVERAANDMIRKAKLISMQLDVSHQETQIAIKQSIEAATEGIQQTAESIDEYAQVRSEALLKNTQLATQTIESVVAGFEKNIQNIKLPDQIFVEKLDIPLTQLSSRLDETQHLLAQFNIQQGNVSQNTQEIIANMAHSMNEIELLTQSMSSFNAKLLANTQLTDDFSRVVKEISSLSEQTGGISENLQQQTTQSVLAMQNFSKLMAAVNTLPDEIETLSGRLRQSSGQFTQTFQAFGDNTDTASAIANDLQEISTALSNSRETVKQIADFGIQVTATFKHLETFKQLMTDMSGLAEQDIELVKQHQMEIADILQQSRQSLLQTQQDLVGGNQ